MKKETKTDYTPWQIVSLTLLRIVIGWHFLYEGLIKIYDSAWTSKIYLQESVGPMAHFFKSLTQHKSLLYSVDLLNKWGLVLIGTGLFAGLLSKWCKIFGMALLALYYLVYPPFAGLGNIAHVEGSYWLVNKNLIELIALFVLYQLPTSHITGIDRFIFKKHLGN
ncbi:MAG: DoxX subfamily [Mangrovibacterium sp.]